MTKRTTPPEKKLRTWEQPDTALPVAGWTRLDAILDRSGAEDLARRCLQLLAELGSATQVGDKPHAGTRRLVNLEAREPSVHSILNHEAVTQLVTEILGPDATCTEVTFRCPLPGFGAQKLHTDDVPLFDCSETRGLTGIMPLVEFTSENGATRIVPGSHRRADLQRLGGNLDSHPDEIRMTGRPGDLFLFSRHLLHSGTPNNSGAPRPALQISWQR